MLNSEEIKPIALAVIELRLFEGISQIVSQSVRKCVKLEVFKILVQWFRVDLKIFFWAWL